MRELQTRKNRSSTGELGLGPSPGAPLLARTSINNILLYDVRPRSHKHATHLHERDANHEDQPMLGTLVSSDLEQRSLFASYFALTMDDDDDDDQASNCPSSVGCEYVGRRQLRSSFQEVLTQVRYVGLEFGNLSDLESYVSDQVELQQETPPSREISRSQARSTGSYNSLLPGSEEYMGIFNDPDDETIEQRGLKNVFQWLMDNGDRLVQDNMQMPAPPHTLGVANSAPASTTSTSDVDAYSTMVTASEAVYDQYGLRMITDDELSVDSMAGVRVITSGRRNDDNNNRGRRSLQRTRRGGQVAGSYDDGGEHLQYQQQQQQQSSANNRATVGRDDEDCISEWFPLQAQTPPSSPVGVNQMATGDGSGPRNDNEWSLDSMGEARVITSDRRNDANNRGRRSLQRARRGGQVAGSYADGGEHQQQQQQQQQQQSSAFHTSARINDGHNDSEDGWGSFFDRLPTEGKVPKPPSPAVSVAGSELRRLEHSEMALAIAHDEIMALKEEIMALRELKNSSDRQVQATRHALEVNNFASPTYSDAASDVEDYSQDGSRPHNNDEWSLDSVGAVRVISSGRRNDDNNRGRRRGGHVAGSFDDGGEQQQQQQQESSAFHTSVRIDDEDNYSESGWFSALVSKPPSPAVSVAGSELRRLERSEVALAIAHDDIMASKEDNMALRTVKNSSNRQAQATQHTLAVNNFAAPAHSDAASDVEDYSQDGSRPHNNDEWSLDSMGEVRAITSDHRNDANNRDIRSLQHARRGGQVPGLYDDEHQQQQQQQQQQQHQQQQSSDNDSEDGWGSFFDRLPTEGKVPKPPSPAVSVAGSELRRLEHYEVALAIAHDDIMALKEDNMALRTVKNSLDRQIQATRHTFGVYNFAAPGYSDAASDVEYYTQDGSRPHNNDDNMRMTVTPAFHCDHVRNSDTRERPKTPRTIATVSQRTPSPTIVSSMDVIRSTAGQQSMAQQQSNISVAAAMLTVDTRNDVSTQTVDTRTDVAPPTPTTTTPTTTALSTPPLAPPRVSSSGTAASFINSTTTGGSDESLGGDEVTVSHPPASPSCMHVNETTSGFTDSESETEQEVSMTVALPTVARSATAAAAAAAAAADIRSGFDERNSDVQFNLRTATASPRTRLPATVSSMDVVRSTAGKQSMAQQQSDISVAAAKLTVDTRNDASTQTVDSNDVSTQTVDTRTDIAPPTAAMLTLANTRNGVATDASEEKKKEEKEVEEVEHSNDDGTEADTRDADGGVDERQTNDVESQSEDQSSAATTVGAGGARITEKEVGHVDAAGVAGVAIDVGTDTETGLVELASDGESTVNEEKDTRSEEEESEEEEMAVEANLSDAAMESEDNDVAALNETEEVLIDGVRYLLQAVVEKVGTLDSLVDKFTSGGGHAIQVGACFTENKLKWITNELMENGDRIPAKQAQSFKWNGNILPVNGRSAYVLFHTENCTDIEDDNCSFVLAKQVVSDNNQKLLQVEGVKDLGENAVSMGYKSKASAYEAKYIATIEEVVDALMAGRTTKDIKNNILPRYVKRLPETSNWQVGRRIANGVCLVERLRSAGVLSDDEIKERLMDCLFKSV